MTKKIKDLNPFGCLDLGYHYEFFKGLVMNALKIEGIQNHSIEDFVKSKLIENNKIGYSHLPAPEGVWAVTENIYTDLDIYGLPKELRFIYANGKGITHKAYYEPSTNGAYLIHGIPAHISLSTIIHQITDQLALCDSVIQQNLAASRAPLVITVKEKEDLLSIEQAIYQENNGIPVIKVSPTLADSIKGVNFSTPYIVDKIYDYRTKKRDELLNILGTMSANVNKKERVQVGEVNATVGQCVDYIYMMIDHFNEQCESYGLPFKMKLNNSLEELYTNDSANIEENNVQQGNDT